MIGRPGHHSKPANRYESSLIVTVQRAKYTAHTLHLKVMHGFAHNWVWSSLQLILISSTLVAGLVQA